MKYCEEKKKKKPKEENQKKTEKPEPAMFEGETSSRLFNDMFPF